SIDAERAEEHRVGNERYLGNLLEQRPTIVRAHHHVFLKSREAGNVIALFVLRVPRLNDFRRPEPTHHFADGHGGKIAVHGHPDAHRRVHREIFHLCNHLASLQLRPRGLNELQVARRDKAFGPRLQNELSVDRPHVQWIIAQQYLKKGSLVFIEGRIQSREWQDKEGQKRDRKSVV